MTDIVYRPVRVTSIAQARKFPVGTIIVGPYGERYDSGRTLTQDEAMDIRNDLRHEREVVALEPVDVADLIRNVVHSTVEEQARQKEEEDRKRREFSDEVRRRLEDEYLPGAFKPVTGFTRSEEATS